jgi:Cd2+/Zn2+-exporting ATPase
MEIAPESANLLHEDGTVETIDPDDVEIGNILVIRPGEKVPVDGVVVDGSSMVDTAALTGESVPRSVRKDDEILSGCINGEGLLKIRASKEYEDSTVSRILEMVEEATSKKSRTEDFITRFARWYTPLVVLGAVILAVIPSIITRDPLTWIYRACTFLVISCPCALVISVPLSFFGGIGAASREGVLVKGSNYLELMAELDTVVSDKTGTLTKGEFTVTKTSPASGVTEQELLETAAFAEGLSTHPIAASIRRAAGKSGKPCRSGIR